MRIWLCVCQYCLLSIPFALNLYYTNMQDLYSRVLINDFVVNSFYYLWTSFWFIPLLLFSILCYFLVTIYQVKTNIKYLLLLLIWLCSLFDFLNYACLNLSTNTLLSHTENFNNLLTNSVNKFHPGIFYMSSLPIILVLFLSNNCKHDSNFNLVIIVKTYLITAKTNLILVSFTLFLGGWWALQEGSWGGWWNWDPSEVFGLIFIFLYAWQLHQLIFKKNFLQIFTSNVIWFYIILLLYIFIQLNFDLVSHNFGTKTDQFINALQFYEINLSMVIIFFVIYSCSIFKNLLNPIWLYHNFNYTKKDGNLMWWVVVSGGVVLYQTVNSFLPLLNDFLWKIFSINITNVVPNWTYVNIILINLLYVYLWKPKPALIAITIVLLPWTVYNSLNFNMSYLRWTRTVLFHLLIILALNVSTINSILISSYWSFEPSSLSFVTRHKFWYYYETVKLNNNFLDFNYFTLTSNTLTSTFNFTLFDTSNEIHSFVLQTFTDFQQQSLILGSLFLTYTINTYDFFPQSIFNLFFLWLILVSNLLSRNQIIIF